MLKDTSTYVNTGRCFACRKEFSAANPDESLYVIDSAQAIDTDTHWQILMPRTDWTYRMPNRATFEVDKLTSKTSIRPVK